MAPRRFVAWALPFVVCACSIAVAQDRLVPVRPGESHGIRANPISFARPQEPLEELPRPAADEPHSGSSFGRGGNELLWQDELGERAAGQTLEFGTTEPIVQRYPDGKVQIVRHVRQDAEGNFQNHGPWKLYSRNGQLLAEGEFYEGLMHGPWTRWHPADDPGIASIGRQKEQAGPFISTATFERGELEGSWILMDRQRQKIFEMPYVGGERHGTAMWWSASGELLREVSFDRGRLHGEVIEYDAQRQPQRRTQFEQGRRVFSEVHWYRPGHKQTEEYFLDAALEIDGADDWWSAQPAGYARSGEPYRHGAAQSWYENGQLQREGAFRQGKKQGNWRWWHANGQLQLEGVYGDDQKQGTWTWWHANGMKAVQGSFELDRAVGSWSYWDSEGRVLRKGEMSGEEIPTVGEPLEQDLPTLAPPSTDAPGEAAPPATSQDRSAAFGWAPRAPR